MTPPKTKKRRSQTPRPLVVIGGIDPSRAYSLPEFRAITGITRQKLSKMRREENPLIVRDAGTPTILGQDWIDFAASRPVHVAKQRRPATKISPSPVK